MVPMDDSTTTMRRRMVDRLRTAGVLVTPAVEEAMRRVPRDLFLPGPDAHLAYVDDAVTVKRSDDGTPMSSASQPTMVATMLEQLQVVAGHHVLEVGYGDRVQRCPARCVGRRRGSCGERRAGA
jgi:protein-L-isoaspartate(D-aspartate) O-methyltransferase